MMQKNDLKYTFVVSHSSRSLIRVRRFEVSKRLIHVCASAAIFTFGIFSYGSYDLVDKSNSQQILTAHYQSSVPVTAFNSFLQENDDQIQFSGEGGPEGETFLSENHSSDKLENKNRDFEKLLPAGMFIPSIFPLIGKINNEYGWRRNPFGGSASEHHSGMDIDGKKGDPIIAPANGVILKAGWQGGYGNLVEIDHGNGLTTRYGHLSNIKVEVGQEIARGQEIGKVGSTGRSTGPHLHYEVRVNGEAVDPRPYLPQDVLLVE